MSRDGDGHAPLSAYGMIGDGRAGALVAADGAVDWLAAPRLDSPPVCAALLDPAAGGAVTLEPAVPYEAEQHYLENTMVLATTFRCAGGTVTVTDALNRGLEGPLPWTELARRIDGVSGEVPLRWRVRPGHQLGTVIPRARWWRGVPVCDAGAVRLAVVTGDAGSVRVGDSGVAGECTVRAGKRVTLAVVAARGEPLWVPRPADIEARLDGTVEFWRRWCADVGYEGPHADAVRRSALVLKALTLVPSCAIAAALTTSLPERIGGDLNFDYRFGWVRDSSFALDAMARIGLAEEVHASLSWLLDAVQRTAPEVRSLYTLDGAPASARMTTLDSVPGYRGSRPVTIGNGAAEQLQLGAYGDLLDAVWRYTEHGGLLDAAGADTLRRVVNRVCELWRTEDAGIWELGGAAHYTISKMNCWAALDRAVRLAESGQLADGDASRWRAERAAVREWTDEHCWSRAKRSYTFHAGTEDIDAAVLLAARTGYLAPDDPRLASTIDAVRAELGAGGPLLYRYTGVGRYEGAFLCCTFWLVEALGTAGMRDEAAALFDDALGHLGGGVLSEQIDPGSGELLGNLPQGLTHLALVGAATTLWPTSSSLDIPGAAARA